MNSVHGQPVGVVVICTRQGLGIWPVLAYGWATWKLEWVQGTFRSASGRK